MKEQFSGKKVSLRQEAVPKRSVATTIVADENVCTRFKKTICHPLSQARIQDAVQNPLNILKAAWAGKVSKYAGMVHDAGRCVELLPSDFHTWWVASGRSSCSLISGNFNYRSWNAHIQFCQEHFVPATCCITRDDQCSLSHFRSSVSHLWRNLLFHLSA